MSNDNGKPAVSPRGCLVILFGGTFGLLAILYMINRLWPGSVCCGGM